MNVTGRTYLFGYLRRMSLITIVISCTTYETLLETRSIRTLMHLGAAISKLIASHPIARIDLRTNIISISVAYLYN